MAKKNKFLKDLLKKKIDLPKIKLPSVNLLEDTKNKINNYYTDFKKNREKEKKRAEKRKILEEKKALIKQKKQDQKETHINLTISPVFDEGVNSGSVISIEDLSDINKVKSTFKKYG